eukprot:TRINITY_DN9442_c0_g1_i1.p3 TRINITY_DN9442_c0_g1~~TRINITY_DN9442_c0_g1_i1.p3  ORF type:complete len:100 (-),score=35.50 TRINITY_DN9442_c0_g1_i1:91-390(-)
MQGQHDILDQCLGPDLGFGIDFRDQLGLTPLHWAACNGHDRTVAVLLRHGADPLLKDQWGQTAQHLAARKGHPKVVEVLQRHTSTAPATSSVPLGHPVP